MKSSRRRMSSPLRAPQALVFTLALWGGAGCSSVDSQELESHQVRSAILGGTADTTHRAVVALLHTVAANPAEASLCSGSVIHQVGDAALVLTAAHCVVELDAAGDVSTPVVPLDAAQLLMTTGDDYQAEVLAHRLFNATQVWVAPGYYGYLGNSEDIALVRFNGVPENLPRLTVLTPETDQLTQGEALTLVGFGSISQGENTLRRTTNQTIGWLSTQFIGMDQTNGHGICHGDSGGPALVTEPGGEVIAGINDLAKGTGDTCDQAGTVTRVARFAPLIATALATFPPSPGDGAAGATGTAGVGGTTSATSPGPTETSDSCSFAIPRRDSGRRGLTGAALLFAGAFAFRWRLGRRRST